MLQSFHRMNQTQSDNTTKETIVSVLKLVKLVILKKMDKNVLSCYKRTNSDSSDCSGS